MTIPTLLPCPHCRKTLNGVTTHPYTIVPPQESAAPLYLDIYDCPNCKKCVGVELAWSGTGQEAHACETWNRFVRAQEKATQSAEYRAIFGEPIFCEEGQCVYRPGRWKDLKMRYEGERWNTIPNSVGGTHYSPAFEYWWCDNGHYNTAVAINARAIDEQKRTAYRAWNAGMVRADTLSHKKAQADTLAHKKVQVEPTRYHFLNDATIVAIYSGVPTAFAPTDKGWAITGDYEHYNIWKNGIYIDRRFFTPLGDVLVYVESLATKSSGLCVGARVKLTEYGVKKIEEVRAETVGKPWNSNLYPKNRVFKVGDPGVLLHADVDGKGIWDCDLGGVVIYVDDKMVEVTS